MDELARHRAKRRRFTGPVTPADPVAADDPPEAGDLDVLIADLIRVGGMAVELEAEATEHGDPDLLSAVSVIQLSVTSALRLANYLRAEGGR